MWALVKQTVNCTARISPSCHQTRPFKKRSHSNTQQRDPNHGREHAALAKEKSGLQSLPVSARVRYHKLNANDDPRSNFADCLNVVVGEKDRERTFVVHKDLICQNSRFFKRATSSTRWIEARKNAVKLPEHEPDYFQLYLEGIYDPTANLLMLSGGPEKESVLWSDEETRVVHQVLSRTWVLGDYLMDTGFKNRVMAALLSIRRRYFGADLLRYIARNTAATSVLQQWAVEFVYRCTQGTPVELQDKAVKNIPDSMLRAFLRRSLRNGGKDKSEMIPADSEDYFE